MLVVIGPIVYSIVVYPKFGMLVLIIMAYMLFVIAQLGVDGPVGTMMDALQLLLILGMLIRMKKAAGRPKDFETVAELELLRERRRR